MALVFALALALITQGLPASAGEDVHPQTSVSDPMLLFDSRGITVRGHVQYGINIVTEGNLFWDLAELATGNTEFEADAEWLEQYIEPGISFDWRFQSGSALFGKISAVASRTSGTDAFDASNTGRVTLEEGYLGYRSQFASDWTIETTLGPRLLRLGTGMLIANGNADGFERGALKFGPREAWEIAGVMQIFREGAKATVFYLDANELSSNDTRNRIGGIDLRWDGYRGGYSGFTYLRILESEAPYPQAATGGNGPPAIIPGAREDLNILNFYGQNERFDGSLSNLVLALDLGYQWNEDIDLRAWGGRLKFEYTFMKFPWNPVFSYSYQIFSGDDPETTCLERFDPLYYDGSPSAWATGSKSAMVFINSNVQSHGFSFRITPTPRNILTMRYAHVRAHELRSPVQFGQATRLDFSDGISTVISGVTDAHLSDDFFVEYNRIINPNIYLNAGVSISIPGKGIKDAAGGEASSWTGGFINVVFNY